MFGLVGYGGPGWLSKEHVHTFDGEIFGKSVSFLKGVEDIRFSSSGVAGRALDALRYATHLPFRTGVAKVIVFIPALSCEAGLVTADLQHRLTAGGFVMHILRGQRLAVGSGVPAHNTVIFGELITQLLAFQHDGQYIIMYEFAFEHEANILSCINLLLNMEPNILP